MKALKIYGINKDDVGNLSLKYKNAMSNNKESLLITRDNYQDVLDELKNIKELLQDNTKDIVKYSSLGLFLSVIDSMNLLDENYNLLLEAATGASFITALILGAYNVRQLNKRHFASDLIEKEAYDRGWSHRKSIF